MRHAEGINAMYKEYEGMHWRTGRRVGQCVHAQVHSEPSEDDVLLFECPSPDVAALVVKAHNFWRTSKERVWEATEAEYQANKRTHGS